MSVYRGRPELAHPRSERRDWPSTDIWAEGTLSLSFWKLRVMRPLLTVSSASDCAYLSLQPSGALGLEMFRPRIAKTDKFCLQIFFESRSRDRFTAVISQLYPNFL